MDHETKPKMKPTAPSSVMRKKKALKIWQENGFKNLNKALIEVGYSAIAVDKGRITNSKSWRQLVQEYLPDDLLAKRHMELLNKREYELIPQYEPDPHNAKKSIKTYKKIDLGPDTNAVAKGLDLAYKIQGKFKEQVEPNKGGNTYNLFFDPKVREARKLYEDTIKQQIKNASIKRIKTVPNEEEASQNSSASRVVENSVDSGEGNQGTSASTGGTGEEE